LINDYLSLVVSYWFLDFFVVKIKEGDRFEAVELAVYR